MTDEEYLKEYAFRIEYAMNCYRRRYYLYPINLESLADKYSLLKKEYEDSIHKHSSQ